MIVEIYNTTVSPSNFIGTINIKPYKQLKRIVDKLKDVNKHLTKDDFKNKRIRYYIFKVNNNTILSEKDLINWSIKRN